jgi:hypothetical protein
MPAFMFLLFLVSVYFLSFSGLLKASPRGNPGLASGLPAVGTAVEALSISSTTIFFVLCLGGLQQAFETFYLAPDLALLLTSPISRRAVLACKFLTNMRWDALMVFMTAVPIWVAFGIWLRVPLAFYLALGASWLALLFLVSGLAVALTMLLVRIISGPQLRQILLSFLFAFVLLLAVLMQGALSGLWRREGIMSLLEQGMLTRQVWLPPVWLSRGLVALMTGNPREAWAWLAILGAGAALALAIAYGISQRLYAVGWVSAQGAEALAGPQHGRKRWSRQASPVFALVRKDLRLFSRQPVEWYRAALGAVAMAAALVAFTSQERQPSSAVVLSLVMGLVGASTFAVNLSLRGVTKESLSWWILQASPLSELDILRAKFLTAFLPTGLYACLALAVMQRVLRLPLLLFPFSVPVMLVMVAGLTALDMAVGIWRADFQQAAETRNADMVAVLVSQMANYFLLGPGLLLLSLSTFFADPRFRLAPLSMLLVLAALVLPMNALVVVVARHYSLRGIRALRLSEVAARVRLPGARLPKRS